MHAIVCVCVCVCVCMCGVCACVECVCVCVCVSACGCVCLHPYPITPLENLCGPFLEKVTAAVLKHSSAQVLPEWLSL